MTSFFFCSARIFSVLLLSGYFYYSHAAPVYWFISAGTGFSQESDMSDINSDSRQPPALFGQGYQAEGEHENISNFGVGIGYRMHQAFIIELAYDYQSMAFKGNANFKNAGTLQPTTCDLHADSLLLGTKIDLLGFFADTQQKVRPFVSIAGGITQINTQNVHFSFPALKRSPTTPSITTTAGGNDRHGLFRVGTGIDWFIRDNIGLSLSYQYYDLGKLKTNEGVAYVYGHGCHKASDTFGCNLYVDGLEADVRTNIFSVNFWRTF